jgi:two-component system, OmpR family, KDP operon response regulator KdpE
MTPARTDSVHILVVEDDASIRHILRTALEAEGHVVHEAHTARDGQTLAGNRPIDLFLIDLGLPDADGLSLIRHLRSWTRRPILVLSARTEESQKVEALDAGADDYVTKPFGVAELHARLRVAVRHARQTGIGGATALQFGRCRVDLMTKSVQMGGEPVHLTATQWRLLEVLCRHAGRVVTSRQLLKEVWGPGQADQAHYLRIYVRQLRQKLQADPANPVYLKTETGVGYRLRPDNEPS